MCNREEMIPVNGVLELLRSILAQVAAYFLCEWISGLLDDKNSKH